MRAQVNERYGDDRRDIYNYVRGAAALSKQFRLEWYWPAVVEACRTG